MRASFKSEASLLITMYFLLSHLLRNAFSCKVESLYQLKIYKYFSRDHESLDELGGAAADVSKALNELLNHVKDSGPDKIPDIMDQVQR